jgi:hypothetical protein
VAGIGSRAELRYSAIAKLLILLRNEEWAPFAAICELGKKWRSKRDPSSAREIYLRLCREDN